MSGTRNTKKLCEQFEKGAIESSNNVELLELTIVQDVILAKKIENTVVEGYKKIEDKFVNQYLTKDEENVEETKARLKREERKSKKIKQIA